MKNPEEAIEKVLVGLREAEAPAGIERRVLDAVEGRAAEGTHAGWHRLGRFFTPGRRGTALGLMGGLALAGVAGVAVLLVASHEPGPGRSMPDRAHVEAAAPVVVATHSAQLLPAEPDAGLGRKTRLRRVKAARNGDSVALREMRAASHPAPPLPLTEQEKLLLQVARAGNPQEMAMLNPEIRAKKEAQSDAEFRRFFERSAADRE